jgi:type I restriction enzyme S subunit
MRAWQGKRLGDVCEIENERHSGGAAPYVGMEDIESGTGVFLGALLPTEVKSQTFRFSPAHVLYGRLRPYLNKVIMPEFAGHCSTEIFPLKPRPTLDRRFLFYWLTSASIVKKIDGTCTGARMPRANLNAVLDFDFALPPLPEQRRIVAILDEAFTGLEVTRANAEKNLQNARELFERYLLSVVRQGGLGWKDMTLKEISIDFGRGKSRHRPRGDMRLLGGTYPLIQTGDVANSDHRITEYSQTYNEFGLAQSKLWPKGTVCIAIVGANVAETAVLDFDACFPDSVIGIVVNERLANNDFVEFLLQTFKVELKLRGKGTARDNINLATFENQTFQFPDITEQNRIVARLDDMAAEANHLASLYTRKLAAIAELKQSVLQQAFSGQLTSTQSLAA